jgi:peptidoglycan/xylan/chitin deacetylase (PgdA/CDA1 family)
MSSRPSIICPTLHVERLEDDRVWTRLRRALELVVQRGGHATMFVSTLSARHAGADLESRLGWIAGHGHEIAMHTHFRHRGRPDAERTIPLTGDDVVASLEADYAYLVDRGHRPGGFCAGAWSMSTTTTEWLRSRAFQYDCSFRSFALRYDNPAAAAGSGRSEIEIANGVVATPTTATLKAMVFATQRRRCASLPEGGRYALFYLHDYDLLDRRKEVAFRLAMRRVGSASVVPVQELLNSIAAGRA